MTRMRVRQVLVTGATGRVGRVVLDLLILVPHGPLGISPLAPPFEVYTGWALEIADLWCKVFGFTDYVKEPARARA